MFNKFEERCKLGDNWRSAYAMNTWKYQNSRERRRRFLDSMQHKLICQTCRGRGQEIIDRVDYYNIYGECGWCLGEGRLTPWERGFYLRAMKKEKILR